MLNQTNFLKKTAIALAFVAVICYLDEWFSYSPRVNLINTESELEEILQLDDFMVFGLYNSLLCKKCLSYFQKIKSKFDRNETLANYDFQFQAIDRALFMNRGQQFDYMTSSNMILFYSKKRLYFFHEFTRLAPVYNNRKKIHDQIFEEGIKYLQTQIKMMRELTTLAEVNDLVMKEGEITVFMGPAGEDFELFRELSKNNFDIPLFYIRDEELIDQVFIYYTGMWVPQVTRIMVLKRHDRVNYAEMEPYAIIPFERDVDRLLRHIIIQTTFRLQVDPPSDMFLRAVMSTAPIILFVESPILDPDRQQKVGIWFDFIRNTEKTFISYVIGNNNYLLRTYEVLQELTRIPNDWVYVLLNEEKGTMRRLRIFKVAGEFTAANLIEQVQKFLNLAKMAPKPVLEPSEIGPKAMDLLKRFFMGKSLDLPKMGDILG